MRNTEYTVTLQSQIQRDLKARAYSGTFTYTFIWLLIATWAHIYQNSPILFTINTIIFLTTAGIRYYYLYHYDASSSTTLATIEYRSLIGLILFNALHWGVMSSWLIFSEQYQHTKWPVLIVLLGIALGGTAFFNIFRLLGTAYPLLMIAPPLITGLFLGTADYSLLVGLSVILAVYIFHLCKTVNYSYINTLLQHQAMQKHAKEMEQLSTIDPVTSLNNRLSFSQQFKDVWQEGLQSQNPVSLLYIDLDFFKRVNDQHSHLAGDACLKAVAQTFKACLGNDAVIARYGGEEFTILLPNTNLEKASNIASQLNQAIRTMPFTWSGQRISITCSIGLSSLTPSVNTDRIELIEMADEALYQAKSNGRDKWVASSK